MCSVTAGIVLTRVIGAGSLIFLPKAKKEGLGQTFAGSASKKGAGLWFGALLVVSLGAIFACSFWGGILITCGTIGIVVFYRRMAITQFGGVTGDLSGWLVQTGEVGMLFLLMLGEHIGGVIG